MTTKTTLHQDHIDHLLTEGFTQEQIDSWVANGDIESLTPNEARDRGFGVCKLIDPENSIYSEPLTGGLLLKFSDTFIQLRTNKPDLLPKPDGKPTKYLTPIGRVIDTECALIPEGCKAITEGWKDAKAFSLLGIPTGAITGLSVGVKALPQGCGYPIIGDHDAWVNFGVTRSLIRLSIHCEGKIAVVPEIKGFPKAGGVEYSKDGNTAEDFHLFLANALTPHQMYLAWLDKRILRLDTKSPAIMADVAVEASKLLAELYGKSTSPTKAEIKVLLKSTQFEGFGLDVNSVLRDSGNTVEQLKAEIREESGGNIDAVAIAMEIVKQKAKLFRSPKPDSIEYVSIPDEYGVITNHPVTSSTFKSWLVGEFYVETGVGLTSENKSAIIATVTAMAMKEAPELPVSEKRVASHNGRYYLYLADANQTVIEYSAIGWNICQNSPVKFIFDKYKAALPTPHCDGEIDKLWEITRIKDNLDSADRLMVASVLVKALVPGGSDPLLAISGYAGSGKTTTANYLRSLIDPFTKGGVLSKLPENSDNIAIHAMKRLFVAIDNLTYVSNDQSDLICTILTPHSGSVSKRKNFSDSEEIIHDIQNVVILTSIGNVVTKPDLLERSICIDLPRITNEDRQSESDITEKFSKYHAELLGGLLDLTVAALHHRDTEPPVKFNRLTEFICLGEGVERKMGYLPDSMKTRMDAGVEIANNIAIESSPVASTLRSWIEVQKTWDGAASDLLNILKTHAKKSELAGSLPKNANSLGSELKRVESALYQAGIKIEYTRTKTNRMISVCIYNSGDDDTSKTLSSLSPDEKEMMKPNDINTSSDDNKGDKSKKSLSPTKTPKSPEPNPINTSIGDNDFLESLSPDDEYPEIDMV